MKQTIGSLVRTKRLEAGLTLRKFCRDNDLDPAYVSRLERDCLIPSKEEILAKIAKALKIKEGTEEWTSFFDLASLSKGEIPKDLKNNPAFIKSLPLFFRTVRGKKPTKKDLQTLVNTLEKAEWK